MWEPKPACRAATGGNGSATGCPHQVSRPAKQLDQLPPTQVARQRAGSGTKGPRGRDLSCVTRGRLCLIAAVWLGQAWPAAALWPEEWPQHFPAARPLPPAKQQKRQKQRERQRVKRRKRKVAQREGKGKKAAQKNYPGKLQRAPPKE